MIESYLALSLPGNVAQIVGNELVVVAIAIITGHILRPKHGAECALSPKILLRIPLIVRGHSKQKNNFLNQNLCSKKKKGKIYHRHLERLGIMEPSIAHKTHVTLSHLPFPRIGERHGSRHVRRPSLNVHGQQKWQRSSERTGYF
ncbi:hypothetical protein CDAR_441621 [Caerostris darwini]|uniref:Uncharacterized protein n=1 Tax=Caerostris darwini TaxID=1538125 RepID=A0AAV4QMJ8_9ARAC|nr:hypothetical protein CDAR_441621 [Caerostris darwini]